MMRLIVMVLIAAAMLHADINRFESFVTRQTVEDEPPSAAVAVLKGGEIIYEGAFGFNDYAKSQPSSLESVYHVFSLTKILTATAMMQLVEEKRASLDERVSDYFPRFRARYDDKDVPVTILNLLNHSSGISDFSGDYRHMFDDGRYAQAMANGEELEPFVELEFVPGSQAQYSSSEYVVLGYLIEKITGRAFEEVIAAKILEPAGMKRSGFTYSESMESDEVHGTVKFFSMVGLAMRLFMTDEMKDRYEGTTLWLNQFDVQWAPAGGLVGSVHDMGLFLHAYLSCSLFNAKTAALINDQPTVKVHNGNSAFDDVRFGIGWYHLKKEGESFLQHQGIGPGFRNIMRIYPEHDLSFVILTSQSGTDIDRWADILFKNFKEEGL
jgi:CubicO group peptidase (beta-lactamase class C family)